LIQVKVRDALAGTTVSSRIIKLLGVQEENWTMSPTLFEIGVALVMVAVIVALLVWFARYLRASSERRMVRMLMRAGVDPDIAARGDKEAIIEDIRSRCQKCQAEDLCERWLAGKVEGENTFCPNARIFSALTNDRGRSEAS
jgi:E3 ubiquitin-protein ligase DOA10